MAERPQDPLLTGAGLGVPLAVSRKDALGARLDRLAPVVFVLPAVLVVLAFSIFPLILSLYISLIRLQFVPGGFQLTFVGLSNYANLLGGLGRAEFLGVFGTPSVVGWFVLGLGAAALAWWLTRCVRAGRRSTGGLVGRAAVAAFVGVMFWLLVFTLARGGRPGSLAVTLIYVLIGVTVQYLLGLRLAQLCVQRIPLRRFFRVVFLLPMMITPVGIAYTFRMLTDTGKGPFFPIWKLLGWSNYSWVTIPWGARAAVMIGDIWQWTPFMFIVLLAALESQPVEPIEAAVVDGASPRQIFWEITLPAILPVSSTLILIRLIEAFKIIDLPNVLTNGGPGTATEPMTLHAYVIWRALDIGGSAAIAYLLLLVVTISAMSYVNLIHRRAMEIG